jgi:two-component system, LytTR family, response regulator
MAADENLTPLRVYLVDDEPLAVERLERLLRELPGIAIAGSTTDPQAAVRFLNGNTVDIVFLDIQMPGMNGFELLPQLTEQPAVVFTTAYDAYALQAFEVNSIDYLLKPIDRAQLRRALGKWERLRRTSRPDWRHLLLELAEKLHLPHPEYPDRMASRIGEKTYLVEIASVTHFFARDKLAYAAANGRVYPIDNTIADLERKLDPKRFLRIHRSILLNLSWVAEVHSRFGGQMAVFLKDSNHTQLPVARDRVRTLKERLEL